MTREVGSKGVGEQANVPGVAGSWKDLTVSVNQMIVDLGKSTRANEEQDWLKTNLARLSALMQGQAGLEQLSSAVLAELCPEVGAQYGSIFVARREKGEPLLERVSGYGLPDTASRLCFRIGEGLVGQCARERRLLVVEGLPAGYASVRSGTGEAEPHSLILLPLLFQGEVRGVLELASFRAFGAAQRSLLNQLAQMLGVALNTIATSMRSEELLEELRASNAELEKRTAELEDKARQVAQVSRYKSQFLANVSHELRTPLNSLLILAQLLAQNEEGNLTPEQVDHARTILSSGQDLLALINQILDLSKIESGKMQVTEADGHPRGDRRGGANAAADDQGGHRLPRDGGRAGPRMGDDRRAAAAAGAEEPLGERLQVHRTRAGGAGRSPPRRRARCRAPTWCSPSRSRIRASAFPKTSRR